ncbi:bifunctional RNase H/acid phosphatase [Saccharothrix variisporea]|uniref:Putative phosphoglycerate mutase n=1 Tax=Saccharothrix variisporea TaxID=543527 RepID=A0A495XBM3_9PSEU|nr:bifunctional RNase H/acid phosphatase [Saccharothrix variisporea]RKT70515.1 putative phosphoglycerate mutase [Saccharothrix variisporea]
MKVVVEADGGSRGNPGPAGYGAVVRTLSGDVLAERSAGIGIATNNVAEYRGLIAGLRAAAEVGASAVVARMDSKLVVEQLSGRWQVKHPAMKPLVAEAREAASAFESVVYEWVPRDRNKHADRLANEAMDTQAGRPPAPASIVPRGYDNPAEAPPGAIVPAGTDDSGGMLDLELSSAEEGVGQGETAPPASWTGAIGEPTRLYLLRHGQTELSVARRYSGRGNPPLTDVGRRQAEAAARRLAKVDRLTAVVSSPLDRAHQTAQAVAQAVGLDATTHDGLIETDFGGWEGLTFAEAAARDPQVHRLWLGDPAVPAPGGESFDQVHERVRRTLHELLDRHPGGNVVVVSHVTPIKQLLRIALDSGPSLLFRLHLDLASLSVVEFYPDGHCSVRLVNDTSHLG